MGKTIVTAILGLFFTFAAVHPATGQIQLNRSSIEGFFNMEFSVVTAMSFDEEKIVALLETKGADQVWDFTDMEFEFQMSGEGRIQTFSSAAGTLGEEYEHFDQATHVSTKRLTLVK